MDGTTGKAVLDRWSEDPGFRTALRSDPVTAITGIGVELTDEDREFLRAVDWTLSDEELEALAKHESQLAEGIRFFEEFLTKEAVEVGEKIGVERGEEFSVLDLS